MDYSMLVGIRSIRDADLQSLPQVDSSLDILSQPKEQNGGETSKILKTFDRVWGKLTGKRPPAPDRLRPSVFYQFQGGFLATDENDRPLPTVYYLGIIDFLTQYDVAHRIAHVFRSVQHGDRENISMVRPNKYAPRFISFIKNNIRAYVE
ncbi:Phosphatidylinositol-4-phosphate 5-kinase [Quaeritorhiza haematococci]|nr:Phosphatidylinositol-4-phosphate 5-kinase [Quaeritorhiza haematococci]